MANTTPTVFSDAAYNTVLSAKMEPQNNLAQKAVYTVPALTASGTVIGMIPFEAGFSPLSFAFLTADLDSSTNVTLDIGYCYPSAYGTATTESLAAFISGSTAAQTGTSIIWPIAGGLLTGVSFTAAQPGYITVRIGGGATTTSGDITLLANFTYDMKAT